MSTSSRQRPPPSLPSSLSLNHGASTSRRPLPPVSTVVTSPPWARDEPPSPTEQTQTIPPSPHDHSYPDYQMSDVTSLRSNPSTSRWWTFTLPRTRAESFDLIPSSPKPEKKSFRDISLSWMPTSTSQREGASFARKDKDKEGEDQPPPTQLSIPMPAQPLPFTLSHTNTPGWDTPWTARPSAQGPSRHNRLESYGFEDDDSSTSEHQNISRWSRRRKQIRSFILVNTYVPLLFRFINIAFTTAALGIAIRIRTTEIKNHATGAIGSSPSVVIIFAPLTLVHVMIAIYLEYFGRPLGLWRTSAKLAHTLSEVLFICLWSAALSLCFDNFFTSLIPCTSESATAWYNQLPRPEGVIPGVEEGSLGDKICDEQLSLICLVGIGLIAYCSNLIISLYRVFEKIKYHPVVPMPNTMIRRTT